MNFASLKETLTWTMARLANQLVCVCAWLTIRTCSSTTEWRYRFRCGVVLWYMQVSKVGRSWEGKTLQVACSPLCCLSLVRWSSPLPLFMRSDKGRQRYAGIVVEGILCLVGLEWNVTVYPNFVPQPLMLPFPYSCIAVSLLHLQCVILYPIACTHTH